MQVVDRYGRVLSRLRVSVTNRCNFRCFFCHMEGERIGMNRELTLREYKDIFQVCKELGITRVKFTGGEPLLREDIVDLVSLASKYFEDISLTTNGSLLAHYAKELANAGLNRINISLHTLRRDKFRNITGVDKLEEVLHGVELAAHLFDPVKLNVTVMKGVNDTELWSLVEFSGKSGVILQVIELQMTPNIHNPLRTYHYDLEPFMKKLEEEGFRKMKTKRGKTKFVKEEGKRFEIDIVKPIHNGSFCMGCETLRLTSYGAFKPCLMRSDEILLKEGFEKAEIRDAILRTNELRRPYWVVANV